MMKNSEGLRPFLMPGAIIIAGVMISASIFFVSQKPATPPLISMVEASDHARGSEEPAISIVEFLDYRCHYCAQFHSTMKEVIAETDDVEWVVRDYPIFGADPAIASECVAKLAGEDAFFQFAGSLFANQKDIKREYYEKLAVSYGISEEKFGACLSSPEIIAEVKAEFNEAKSAGARGTPFNVIINHETGEMRPVSGALPKESIMSIIESMKKEG